MKILSSLFASFLFTLSFAQKKDLAQTPPMGWNSWNYFACDINEQTIKEVADAIASNGMAEVGYEYIVIDDCWQVARDENGMLVADPDRFPNGIKALCDYVHSKNLKFGIYSDAGKLTCQERPGSLNFEAIDAATFAEWGVDYIKYDWCHHGLNKAELTYPVMGKALYELDKDIVYSVCNWGWDNPWEWAPNFSHLWRTTWDIEACFDCKGSFISKNVEEILDLNAPLAQYAKPGAWNDPDMLEVGNGSLTYNENIAHFSLWCMMAAPLIAGNDVRNMNDTTLTILTHKEMIAIDQDALGIQGYRIYEDPFFEIWLKPLMDGSKAVLFFNRGNDKEIEYTANWALLLGMNSTYKVRDIWQGSDLGLSSIASQMVLAPNSVKVYRLDLVE